MSIRARRETPFLFSFLPACQEVRGPIEASEVHEVHEVSLDGVSAGFVETNMKTFLTAIKLISLSDPWCFVQSFVGFALLPQSTCRVSCQGAPTIKGLCENFSFFNW